jgi:hypothetical protein
MKSPSIAIATVKVGTMLGFVNHEYLAICLANPQLKGTGKTEEEAIECLKITIHSYLFIGKDDKFLGLHEITFDDLICEEVLES